MNFLQFSILASGLQGIYVEVFVVGNIVVLFMYDWNIVSTKFFILSLSICELGCEQDKLIGWLCSPQLISGHLKLNSDKSIFGQLQSGQ